VASVHQFSDVPARSIAAAAKSFADATKRDRGLAGARGVKHNGVHANRAVAELLVVQHVDGQPYESPPHGSPARDL